MTDPATDTIVSRKLGTIKAASTPQVFNNTIWFQGEDNKIWAMPIGDPAKAVNPHGLACLGPPTVAADGFVYFPSKDNVLTVMSQRSPWLHSNRRELIHCTAPLVATSTGDYFSANGGGLFFLMDHNVSSVKFGFDITDVAIGRVGAATYAYVSNKTSKKLQARNLTSPTTNPVTSTVEVQDGPVFTRAGRLYVVQHSYITQPGNVAHMGNGYIELDPITLEPKTTSPLLDFCRTTPVEAPYGNDGYVYSITVANELLMTKQSDPTFKKRISNVAYCDADSNDHPYARPCPLGGGAVIFLDDEKYINYARITLA